MTKKPLISLGHGAGGALMHDLIEDVIMRHLDTPDVGRGDDAAEITFDAVRLAFSTDTFTVKPLFFPGGDIGSLAVTGTVNDVLMKGARPRFLSLGLVIQEGLTLEDFERIIISIGQTARQAGVTVVTGDTKVVGRTEADGVFINTSGVGQILPGVHLSGDNARVGDAVIVSGDIGAHGMAVMAARHNLTLQSDIASDAMPLNEQVLPLLERYANSVHVLRDPTRGGLAATLNEIARSSGVTIELVEADIPVAEAVNAVCNILGFDRLYLPSEGRFAAIVEAGTADKIIDDLKKNGASTAACIGRVAEASDGRVHLRTLSGGRRVIDMPAGELLPRIC